MKKQEYETAIDYHKKAVSKKFKASLKSLGDIYIKLNQMDEAERYLKDAVKARVEGANIALAKYFSIQKKEEDAEMSLKEAVSKGEEDAHLLLGRFYVLHEKPKFKKAEEQFRLAIKKGQINGYEELGKLYLQKKDMGKAIEVLNQGLELKDSNSAHLMAHIMQMKGEFEKSDEMYAKAIELGETSVVDCWAESIYQERRKDKKLFTLDLLEKYRKDYNNDLRYELLYAKIILWNGGLAKSLDIVNNLTLEIFETYNDSKNEKYFQRALSDLVDYFLLLMAKKEYHAALNILNSAKHDEFKAMLKPVYFLLMEELQDEFPSEYLKAGKELTETINDLKKEVEDLRRKQL
jgi:Tfp pilus assembly protein PilF